MPDKEPSKLSIFEAVAAEAWDKALNQESDSEYQEVLKKIADLKVRMEEKLKADPEAEGDFGDYQRTYRIPDDGVIVDIILDTSSGRDSGEKGEITMTVQRSATDRPDRNIVTNYQLHRDGLRISTYGSQKNLPPVIVTNTNRIPVKTAEAAYLDAARAAAPLLK
jgi:hypothetical protein